jgi:hypothetical protein
MRHGPGRGLAAFVLKPAPSGRARQKSTSGASGGGWPGIAEGCGKQPYRCRPSQFLLNGKEPIHVIGRSPFSGGFRDRTCGVLAAFAPPGAFRACCWRDRGSPAGGGAMIHGDYSGPAALGRRARVPGRCCLRSLRLGDRGPVPRCERGFCPRWRGTACGRLRPASRDRALRCKPDTAEGAPMIVCHHLFEKEVMAHVNEPSYD